MSVPAGFRGCSPGRSRGCFPAGAGASAGVGIKRGPERMATDLAIRL